MVIQYCTIRLYCILCLARHRVMIYSTATVPLSFITGTGSMYRFLSPHLAAETSKQRPSFKTDAHAVPVPCRKPSHRHTHTHTHTHTFKDKSVTIATSLGRAVIIIIFYYEADLSVGPSVSPKAESLAKVNPGNVVETSETCVFWPCVQQHPPTHANESRSQGLLDQHSRNFLSDIEESW